ncbi:MAG: hypothetical protein WA461_14645 [Nitrososphaeraceae archaeon]
MNLIALSVQVKVGRYGSLFCDEYAQLTGSRMHMGVVTIEMIIHVVIVMTMQ